MKVKEAQPLSHFFHANDQLLSINSVIKYLFNFANFFFIVLYLVSSYLNKYIYYGRSAVHHKIIKILYCNKL
jgi:hypothetical protein